MPVAPPRPKTPPLTALRAFEAAARTGGFAAAAAELGVTAGAVAAQVKALEENLGAELFDRRARGVELTAVGRRVLPALTGAFDSLGEAVQILRAEAAPQSVHIATLPAIADLWLQPRLAAIRAALPGVSLSVTAMERPPDLKRVPFDLSLFFLPPGEGRALAADVVYPVCAPGLADRLREPADLMAVPCLTDSAWAGDWALWAAQALPGHAFTPRGPVFSLYALAVREARAGAGVLMGHEALIGPDLRAGRLVAPFAQRVVLPGVLSLRTMRPARPGTVRARVADLLSGP
ncbi:MAG: LysR family transcriptional regulator [Paracoccaceae bacterium]